MQEREAGARMQCNSQPLLPAERRLLVLRGEEPCQEAAAVHHLEEKAPLRPIHRACVEADEMWVLDGREELDLLTKKDTRNER